MDEQLGQIAFIRDGIIKKDKMKTLLLAGLFLALVLVIFFALIVGPSSLSVGDALAAFFGIGDATSIRIVQQIRIPRILAGVLAGASLSLAGVILQSTLGNIMASPSTLGVTNAAVFGANLSILVLSGGMLDTGNNATNLVNSVNPYLASTLAFVFSTISVLLILGLSAFRKYSPSVVVLSGLAIGAVWTGLTTLVQYFSSDVGLSAAVIWSFGDLGRATYTDCIIMAVTLAICSVFFFLLRHRYNALLAGEAYAKSIGIRVNLLRFLSLLLASLLVAVSVSRIGLIGFIGIICPHAMRKVLGHDHSYLIPSSILSGSILLLLSDTLGRAFSGGSSVPVGAITALIGAPFFLYLIFSKKEGSNA